MIETYYEAARRTKFRIVLPATSTSNGTERRSPQWEIALRRVFQSVEIDSEERIVMLIQAQVREITLLDIENFIGYLKASQGVIPFGMMIDSEDMHIYAIDSANVYEPICTVKVVDVLSSYDPEIGKRQKSPYGLSGAESWLDDLAYNWKSEIPPASKEMAAIGLLPLLEGGTTRTDVEIRIDILHRN